MKKKPIMFICVSLFFLILGLTIEFKSLEIAKYLTGVYSKGATFSTVNSMHFSLISVGFSLFLLGLFMVSIEYLIFRLKK